MIQKKKLWMIENGFWGMMIGKEVDVCADYRKWAGNWMGEGSTAESM